MNTDGYLKVVDWGDGASSEVTKTGSLSHKYSQAGTYTVRIKGNCQGIRLGYTKPEMIYDTNANWDALGKLTLSGSMFSGCVNAQFKIDKLPESLQTLEYMFKSCHKAEIHIHKLPTGIKRSCKEAFY